MKDYKKVIIYCFFISWAASCAILLYKLACNPININVDLSFIFEFIPLPSFEGTGDNYIQWHYK